MGMGGNGNELWGAIREWEWFFKCVNFGNGNGNDVAGMGGIGNTENHSRTSLIAMSLHQWRSQSPSAHGTRQDASARSVDIDAAVRLVADGFRHRVRAHFVTQSHARSPNASYPT